MIHSTSGPAHLAVVRITVFSIWIVILLGFQVDRLLAVPSELVDAPGLLGPLPMDDMVADTPLMQGIRLAALLGCVLCVLGVRPFPLVAVPTVGLLLLIDGVGKSIGGFTNHAQAAALFVAALLALFPAGDAWSIARRPPDPQPSPWAYRAPLVLSAILITCAYSMIGLRRIVDGGTALVTGPTVELWFVVRSLGYAQYGFDHGLRVLDHPVILWAAIAGMALTTVFEAISPLTLRFARFRTVWLLVIVPFHVATLLTMRIFFWENMVLVVVLLSSLPDRLVRAFDRTRVEEPAPTVEPVG